MELRKGMKRTAKQPASGANELAHALCGCTVSADSDRKAVAVDPDIKRSNLQRLRRIEGQVRGLQKMIDEDRYCADIVVQISSVQEALRGVGRALMRNHLEHCASAAIRSGDQQQASQQYEELLELIFKHLR
jgi:DNA-binding FrmR family transcriptional regulator